MAFSMTGYGRGEETLHGRCITVEVKSVNSRYFEYSSRLPRHSAFLDDPLKKLLASKMKRGKAELHVSILAVEGGETQVTPNLAVAEGYYEALDEISRHLRIENDTKASVLARFQDVFTLIRKETDEQELVADVLTVAEKAFTAYNGMRKAEGDKLIADINSRLNRIEELVGFVEQGSSERVARYTQKLMDRLQEVLADTIIDESRILTEAAIFADKTAVDEETVRLHSHLKQYREILAAEEPIGRKLDFLTQELNRETNTIGSKCQELEITRMVVEMKAEIEKIREQIQNME